MSHRCSLGATTLPAGLHYPAGAGASSSAIIRFVAHPQLAHSEQLDLHSNRAAGSVFVRAARARKIPLPARASHRWYLTSRTLTLAPARASLTNPRYPSYPLQDRVRVCTNDAHWGLNQSYVSA